jgi:hypothetical protein
MYPTPDIEPPLGRRTRMILRELRDLRVEMRTDRRQATEDRRRADAERRQADEAWRQERLRAEARWARERQQSEALTRQVIQRSDERFQQALHEFRKDSVRQGEETRKMVKDIRVVGLSIVKTLNLHTQLLRGVDRKLGALGPWRPSSGNGRGV